MRRAYRDYRRSPTTRDCVWRRWAARPVCGRRALRALAATDQRNNEKLLWRLCGITQRRAHYICVLVAFARAEDPEPLIVDARWHGEIAQAPRGSSGFGYDPLFYVAELGLTAAELDPAQKNRISHRGLALRALAARLADWM